MSIDMEKDYENDIPKHKKKSSAKGTPRADHKHEYETAAIRINRMVQGKPVKIICKGEVCTICGRVAKLEAFWSHEKEKDEVWAKYPHYLMADFMSKTAIREEMAPEPDVTCPECLQKAKYQATWGGDIMYECPNCLATWKAYKNEDGVIRITERYFFG
ncbi:MAG: hypothetical protein UGF89_01790 [Acutalibacteraceae bacterium]|nr:hypothetical protein [Acutalibacteraceae bacterium]